MRKENKFGFIEYRMPTVKEGLSLLHKIGISAETANKEWMTKNYLQIICDMIDDVSAFISKIEMKDGELILSRWEELSKSCRYSEIVQSICLAIFVEINGGDEGN